MGSYDPARIHPVSHRFHPPAKKISFNKMLVMNDGLLAHHIGTNRERTYQTALEEIASEVYKWNKTLKTGRRVHLDGIGSFVLDEQGNLIFNPDRTDNFLREAYGLTSFQATPIDRKERKVEQKGKGRPKIISLPALDRMAKYSVAAAFLSIAMLTTYKLNLVPDLNSGEVTLNPFKYEASVYQPREYDADLLEPETMLTERENKMDDADYFEFLPAGNEGPVFTIVEEPVAKVEDQIAAGRFHVVGGCFGVKSNADNFLIVLKKKGYMAQIPTKLKGLHVVSYQSFKSRSEAETMLKKIQLKENSRAWLLEK